MTLLLMWCDDVRKIDIFWICSILMSWMMKTWRIARRNNLEADFNESYEENTVEASFNNNINDNDQRFSGSWPTLIQSFGPRYVTWFPSSSQYYLGMSSPLSTDQDTGCPRKEFKVFAHSIIIQQTLGAFLSFSEK